MHEPISMRREQHLLILEACGVDTGALQTRTHGSMRERLSSNPHNKNNNYHSYVFRLFLRIIK